MLLACVGGWQWWQGRPVEQPPGLLVADAPFQQDSDAPRFRHADHQLQPRAAYELTARLLGRETYRFDAGAGLSPLDFAVGWGAMSRSEILDRLRISQSNRFLHVRWQELPIPEDELFSSAANMHLVPADAGVRRSLDKMRAGQIVRLRGLLVDAERDDGWRWTTSLNRTDRGQGACELMYVQQAEIVSR